MDLRRSFYHNPLEFHRSVSYNLSSQHVKEEPDSQRRIHDPHGAPRVAGAFYAYARVRLRQARGRGL
jgi:hypothetical protein